MIYSFNNDYSEGAHPRILQAMMETNLEQNNGYSMDLHTNHAKELIRQEIGREDADIHMITGGTQTNLLAISCALKPYQAVICAETGHINVHETGAIEATGHKVLGQPTPDGLMTPALIQKALDWHTDEHMVQPKMVYISNATEVGTQYTKAQLEALSAFCRQKGLYLFLDGARLGSALTSPACDLTLADIARLTDLFYIGGTKNGALFGEALIILNPDLKQDFRFLIKQKGAMLAKGWLLGMQFCALLEDDTYEKMTAQADAYALEIKAAFKEKGIREYVDSYTNQLFVILTEEQAEVLGKEYTFEHQQDLADGSKVVRFCTSWATTEAEKDQLIRDIRAL